MTSSLASSITRSFLSSVPMYINCSADAQTMPDTNSVSTADTSRFMRVLRLREYDIYLPPVVGRRGALVGPVRCVIQVIGNLSRPAAAQMAVEQIALDRLAQAGRAAGDVHFPAGREVQ